MISLYIHIPFCERKCFYCSFVISVGQMHRIDLYLDCLAREARQYQGAEVSSIYIGGGTPTMMACEQLQKLIEMISDYFCFSRDSEWTIEANPEGLDDSKLAILKKGGINRISLGIQSLNEKYLKYLGRNHSAAMAVSAFHRIREAGFSNISTDMMFSFPSQSIDELKEDVAAIIPLESDHISLYTLTVDEHSRFYAQNIKLKNGHDQAKQYKYVCAALHEAGFTQYEVSNFARPSKVSQHNLNYWQGGQYIGLGISAHSHIGAKRYWNIKRLSEYMSSMQKGASIQEGFEELTSNNKMTEALLLGLRMNCGVDVRQIEERFKCFLNEEQLKKVDYFVQGGLLLRENGFLKASSQGFLVLDELCAQLI